MGKQTQAPQKPAEAKAQLITTQAIWTGKERVEKGMPLPDHLTEAQIARLKAIDAVEEDKGE